MLLKYFKFTVIFFASVNLFVYNYVVYASTFISTYKYSEHDEHTRDVLVYKNYLYMANMYWGLRTVDIYDIDNLLSVDHYFPGGGAESVELEMSGNTLFVADRVGGTKLFDISNPAAPSYLTTFPTYDRSSRLAVRGNNLLIGDRLGGLVVLDISNPSAPSEVGRHQRNYETQGIALKNNYAFIANPWQGFYVLDISDFNVMNEIAYYNKPEGTNPGIWDVGISNHHAYALCQSYGIHVIDISDPYSPQYSDELLLPSGKDPTGGDSPPLDIEFLGSYAFVSNGLDGVYVIDISDPSNISIIEHIDTPGYSNGLKISGDLLFIADGNSGVQIYDIHEYCETTIYEDAEDGLTDRWYIYDNTPGGAAIYNVFDADRQSNVIQLSGFSTANGYRLTRDDGSLWHNSTQTVIQWSMKYGEYFVVYIDVETTAGRRYLKYMPVNTSSLGAGAYVGYGLGTDAMDGQWHTFVRDLQVDLELAQPGLTILEVNGFLIRGSGVVDDIRMLDYFEECSDGEVRLCPNQQGICFEAEEICTDSSWSSCDYTALVGYEVSEVTCEDGLDNDCDGLTDCNDSSCAGPPCDEATVYEDAEDGLTDRWYIYDNTPGGAAIYNVFDADRQSNVIQLSGSSTANGYRLTKADGSKWYNNTQTVIEWSMKYSEYFAVYIDVETTAGHRYLKYRPVNASNLGTGEYVEYGLGTDAMDGQWHTLIRDLQADLNVAQPDVSILEVNGFLIRGSGVVDDIKIHLHSQ